MNSNNPNSVHARQRQESQPVERAAWFARLAFGGWDAVPLPQPVKSTPPAFDVMP